MFTKDNASAYGKKGGAKNKANHAHDPEHFAKIGFKGGMKLLETRGKEYFAAIGEIGKRGANKDV